MIIETRRRIVGLVDLKTITIVAGVFLISLAISAYSPNQADALINNLLNNALRPLTQPTTRSDPQDNENPSSPSQSAQPSGTESSNVNTSGQASGIYYEPLLAYEGPLDSIDSAEMVQGDQVDTVDSTDGSVYLFSVSGFGSHADNTPVSQTSYVLQPSGQGWKLFGIAWYWWLAGLGAIYGIALGLKKFKIVHTRKDVPSSDNQNT